MIKMETLREIFLGPESWSILQEKKKGIIFKSWEEIPGLCSYMHDLNYSMTYCAWFQVELSYSSM